MIKIFALISLITINIFAHGGHVHKAPWEACEKNKKEDICSYIDGNKNLYRGTCQYFSTALMCVRNKPIIKASKNNKTHI